MAKKCYTGLAIIIIASILLALAGITLAQTGTCPNWVYGELSPPPVGTQPDSLVLCAGGDDLSIVYDSEYPCGGGILWDDAPVLYDHQTLVLVYPLAMTFPSGKAKVAFTFYANWIIPTISQEPRFTVTSFSSSSVLVGTLNNVEMDDFPHALISLFKGGWYVSSELSETSLTIKANQGGYMVFHMDYPAPEYFNKYMISGIKIYDSDASDPELCEIPDHPPQPPLPTPTPTPTPTTGAGTPTSTPVGTPTQTNTPWPTSAGGTVTPLATATPIVVNTVQSQPTPTQYPRATIQPVIIPGLEIPTLEPVPTFSVTLGIELTPNATTQAQQDEIDSWLGETQTQATRWFTKTNSVGANSSVTATYGFETPYEIGETIAQYVTTPIAYAKAVALYMPNMWPLVLFLILATMWVFFNLTVKYGLALVGEVLNFIWKIWEAIPFVN